MEREKKREKLELKIEKIVKTAKKKRERLKFCVNGNNDQ